MCLPFYFVVAPATRLLATAYLLATQRTTKARCESLGGSDDAKLQLFHDPARDCQNFFLKNGRYTNEMVDNNVISGEMIDKHEKTKRNPRLRLRWLDVRAAHPDADVAGLGTA